MAATMSGLVVPIAIGAVAVVLILGLFNMMRGGDMNTSQKLMRWRVGLQFAAIVIIMATIWFMGQRP
jgi:chromate transport protein ChrA